MSRGLRHKFSNPYSQFSIYLCYSSFVNATVSESPEINDEARWSLIYRRAQEVKAVEAFGLFREQGIEPVLIKGLAAGRFYPGDKARQSIDMDIAVAADAPVITRPRVRRWVSRARSRSAASSCGRSGSRSTR